MTRETYTDGRGNSYHPSADQLLLIKGGWQMARITRRGMIRKVEWINPDTTEVWPQRTALEIEKLRRKSGAMREAQTAMNPMWWRDPLGIAGAITLAAFMTALMGKCIHPFIGMIGIAGSLGWIATAVAASREES
jgi:ABC-type uncharacterized transport system permease subunit